ncbi:MAG: CAP domain-containing protein [Actinomycetota bacterium]
MTALLIGGAAQSAHAARAVERRFAHMVNDTRGAATLSPLKLTDRLTEVARRHSKRMASQGELFHSNLQLLLGHGVSSVGENVATGGSLEELLAAFMASPPHAQNILGSYSRTGVGVYRADGRLWLTQIFAS